MTCLWEDGDVGPDGHQGETKLLSGRGSSFNTKSCARNVKKGTQAVVTHGDLPMLSSAAPRSMLMDTSIITVGAVSSPKERDARTMATPKPRAH